MNSFVSILYVRMVLVLICFAMEGIKPEEDLLFKGACRGSLTLLESALVQGAQIEAEDCFHMTALHWTAFNGHPECLKVLLQNGAQIQAKDCVGLTPLHRAARAGRQECIKILLEKGAQIATKTNVGWTTLHEAARQGHIESIKMLLLGFVRLLVDGTSCKFMQPSKGKVKVARRRLKVALLAVRYAGADHDGPKSKNVAGDLIVSNDYVRAWFLLSDSGLKEDACIVLLSLLSRGEKVDFPLFRLAQHELSDYLVASIKDRLYSVNASLSITSVAAKLSIEKQHDITCISDPELVEENFGVLLRRAIRERFNELLRTTRS